jgi:hypothetical protein
MHMTEILWSSLLCWQVASSTPWPVSNLRGFRPELEADNGLGIRFVIAEQDPLHHLR